MENGIILVYIKLKVVTLNEPEMNLHLRIYMNIHLRSVIGCLAGKPLEPMVTNTMKIKEEKLPQKVVLTLKQIKIFSL